MCTINEDHVIHGSWNITCNRQTFLSFWAIFCPFSLLITWKIKILKLKKTSGDIIIFHISTINDNHMMYDSWDMEHDRQNFLSFWTAFFPFTLLWTQKIKILEKWKKTPEDIIILQMCTINDSHMMYGSWGMECNRQNFLSFWAVFCPLTTQKFKILKEWKNSLEIYYHFTHVSHKWQSYDRGWYRLLLTPIYWLWAQ